MATPPKLSEAQKRRLSYLEPRLKSAARSGDFEKAKIIINDIQSLLRESGHLTRLYQNKNYFFEAAMESGNLGFAIRGFEGIRVAANENTRIHLEATALLAICHLRNGDFEKSKPLINRVLSDEKTIKSETGRREFKRRIIERFDEEGAIASLKNCGTEKLDPDEIHDEAGLLVASKNEDEIYLAFGNAVPEHTVKYLLEIETFSQKQLPYKERKLLPSPEEKKDRKEVGKTLFSSTKRVIWNSLCNPDSEIYKAWFENGMSVVLSKKYISTAVVSALTGMGIGIKALAVTTTALIIKFGLEIYCTMCEPEDVMSARETRKKRKKKKS